MKRHSIPLLLASSAICLLTSSVFAGGPGTFDAPAQIKHFNVYGEGMLVRATEEAGFISGVSTSPTTVKIIHFPSKSSFGGTIGGSYLFDNQSDIRAEFTDYTGKFEDTSDEQATPNTVSYKTTYEAVNLDLGQNWHPVQKLNLHFFTGLAYRNLSDDASYLKTPTIDAYRGVNYIGKSTFKGWGPRFGIDSNYHYFNWLSLIANASISFPYGDMDLGHTKYIADNQNKEQIFTGDGIDKFVPELAGNTGLQFNHDFGSIWAGLEVGFRVTHLMNASLDRHSTNDKGTAPETSGFLFNDISYYGPYLRLSVRF